MSHSLGHSLHSTAKVVEELRPLTGKKNEFAAFVLGFFFGALGVGLYLQSWKDFFLCIALFIAVFVILVPTGPGEVFGVPIGMFFSACYGAYRANTSNKKLGYSWVESSTFG